MFQGLDSSPSDPRRESSSPAGQDRAKKARGFREWITIPMPWWYAVFVVPLMLVVVPPLSRIAWITPNRITVASFVLALIATVCILIDAAWAYLCAGILVHFSYTLDCVDGAVARINRMTSARGAFLDMVLDRWKTIFYSLSLMWISLHNYHDTITTMLVAFNLGLAGLNVFMSYAIKEIVGGPRWSDSSVGGAIKGGSLFGRWMAFTDRIGMRPIIADIEADMSAFCIGLIAVSFYGWPVLKLFLMVSILIHLIPLQLGHFYFALRFLPREHPVGASDKEIDRDEGNTFDKGEVRNEGHSRPS